MIICYMGGTCGDLLSAMIDSSGATLEGNHMVLTSDRQKLKKPHLFNGDQEKEQYLIEILKSYKSIPSHDVEFHIRNNHNVVGIVVDQLDIAMWAANRFKQLHRPHVWEEMTRVCGAKSVEGYAQTMLDYASKITELTDQTINLKDIINGNLVEQLEQYTDFDLNKDLYSEWLLAQILS